MFFLTNNKILLLIWIWYFWRVLLGVEFKCSPCAGVGFLQVLQFAPTTPTTHIRLIGESELPRSVCDWMMSMPCGEAGQLLTDGMGFNSPPNPN